jgi:cell division protein FtsB
MMLFMGVRSKQFNPRSVRAGSKRQKQQDFWQRLLPWVYGAIILVIFSVGVAFYWPVVQKYQNLQHDNQELTRQIEEEKYLTLQSQEELLSLKGDQLYVERMARDILHYGRKGEIIYKFPPYEDNSPIKEREITSDHRP